MSDRAVFRYMIVRENTILLIFITDLIGELNRYWLQNTIFFNEEQDQGVPIGQAHPGATEIS